MNSNFIKIGALKVPAEDFEVPNDRVFRDAWSFGGNPDAGVITVDMNKAKEVWREKIRLARETAFLALDAAFMQALETGADTTTIVAQKQALRDATADPAIDAATTPEELAAVHPAGLMVV